MRNVSPVSEETVKTAIEEWIELLAAEDYPAASAFLAKEDGREWTPDLLKQVVTAHRVKREQVGPSKVTSVGHTSGGLTPRHDVTLRWDDSAVLGEVWYDMPLLGEWSDLTATFLLVPSKDGASIVLEDLRMM